VTLRWGSNGGKQLKRNKRKREAARKKKEGAKNKNGNNITASIKRFAEGLPLHQGNNRDKKWGARKKKSRKFKEDIPWVGVRSPKKQKTHSNPDTPGGSTPSKKTIEMQLKWPRANTRQD